MPYALWLNQGNQTVKWETRFAMVGLRTTICNKTIYKNECCSNNNF